METFVKRYERPQALAQAVANLAWLRGLASDMALPALIGQSETELTFEYVDGCHVVPGDLVRAAGALAGLHVAAHTSALAGATLDRSCQVGEGLEITEFLTPRRRAILPNPEGLIGAPATIYKDTNCRNLLIAGDRVAAVDFDDLSLAPFGYDLAKLVVSLVMTYGRLAREGIEESLRVYNDLVRDGVGDHAVCGWTTFGGFTEMHSELTAKYHGRNGYRFRWAVCRPWALQRSGGVDDCDH